MRLNWISEFSLRNARAQASLHSILRLPSATRYRNEPDFDVGRTPSQDRARETSAARHRRDNVTAYWRINGQVNLDNRLRLALMKAMIWGKAGFGDDLVQP